MNARLMDETVGVTAVGIYQAPLSVTVEMVITIPLLLIFVMVRLIDQVINYFTLRSLLCLDVNECAVDNGGCDQNCTNFGGSYQCSCHTGHLQADGFTCGPTMPGKLLSFTRKVPCLLLL